VDTENVGKPGTHLAKGRESLATTAKVSQNNIRTPLLGQEVRCFTPAETKTWKFRKRPDQRMIASDAENEGTCCHLIPTTGRRCELPLVVAETLHPFQALDHEKTSYGAKSET
jgi:hypothetical protein